MKIYNNNFVQVQSQENLQNTTVNINLYRSLNYIFTLTFTLKNDSARIYGFGKQGMAQWRECSPVSAYQCGPGSNPGVDAICGLSLLLVPSPLFQDVFLRVLRFPALLKNLYFQIPIRPGIWWTKNHFVDVLSPNHYLFIFYLKFDCHPSKLINTNRQSSKLPRHWDNLFCEVLKGRFGRGVPSRRAFKPWPRLKTKIVHFATLFKEKRPYF